MMNALHREVFLEKGLSKGHVVNSSRYGDLTDACVGLHQRWQEDWLHSASQGGRHECVCQSGTGGGREAGQ